MTEMGFFVLGFVVTLAIVCVAEVAMESAYAVK